MLFLAILARFPYSTTITKANVFQRIGGADYAAVFFYAEGCPHCANATPHWNEVSKMYHACSGITFNTINCDRFKSLCLEFDAASTPSLQLFPPRERRGVPLPVPSDPVVLVKSLVTDTHIKPFTSPSSVLYCPPDEIAKATADGWVLLVTDDPVSHHYNHSILNEVANQRDFPVLAQPGTPAIELVYKDEHFPYSGDIEIDSILTFIDTHRPATDIL